MRKPYPIGTYTDASGQRHKKFKDDENYEFIYIKGWPITVWGDGAPVDPQQVLKEIKETQAGPWFDAKPLRRW